MAERLTEEDIQAALRAQAREEPIGDIGRQDRYGDFARSVPEVSPFANIPVPRFRLEGSNPRKPSVNAGVGGSVPFMGGELGFQGNYSLGAQRPEGMLTFRRRF